MKEMGGMKAPKMPMKPQKPMMEKPMMPDHAKEAARLIKQMGGAMDGMGMMGSGKKK